MIYQQEAKKLYLIFDFVEMDLKHFLGSFRSSLTDSIVRELMRQLLNGTLYLHRRAIIHRDLKPQNILINPRNNSLQIADFGLARLQTFSTRALTKEIQSLWYRAPEIIMGQTVYSTEVDIWAIGCTFAELLGSGPLFEGDSEIDQLFKIFSLMGTPHEAEWPGVSILPNFKSTFPKFSKKNFKEAFPLAQKQALDLLQKMLSLNPVLRISAQEAVNHPYFNEEHSNN